jgi:hypothetical protein
MAGFTVEMILIGVVVLGIAASKVSFSKVSFLIKSSTRCADDSVL